MYSKEAFTPYDRFCVCRQLKATLEATGARHMIIGHTPQVVSLTDIQNTTQCLYNVVTCCTILYNVLTSGIPFGVH